MRKFKHLTFTDRLRIEAWERIGVPVKQMALELGVSKSTVYRELKRGRYTRLNSDYTTTECYSPDIAQKDYEDKMSNHGPDIKIGKDFEFAAYVEYKICKEHYSPCAVLGEIKHKGITFDTVISSTTLYRYIDHGVFLTLSNKDLPSRRKRRKRTYKKVRPARPPAGTSIERRPENVAMRATFGNWEMDCVIGKQKKAKVLLVLTERATRMEIIRVLKDKTSASVVRAIDRLEREYGRTMFRQVFRTITVDNGSEFADYRGIERDGRTKLYYCHPYSSFERGSNENQNRMIRRHYPKGTDFKRITAAEVRKVESWINSYPRKILGWASSQELFDEALLELRAG